MLLIGFGVAVAWGSEVGAWVGGATVSVGAGGGGSVLVGRIGVGVSCGNPVGVERGGRMPVGVGVMNAPEVVGVT